MKCNICNENKVSFFASLFGLRHCEQCEQEARRNIWTDKEGVYSPKGSIHYRE